MKKYFASAVLLVTLLSGLAGSAHAAGTAHFSLSPSIGTYTNGSSFSVSVLENGTDVNVVTAKLTYDAAKLSCTSVGGSSAFPNTVSASCGSGTVTISRYTQPGTSVSGAQSVGSINFKAIATGTAVVSFAAGSQIASNGTNAWDGSTSGGSYTITAPVVTPPATPPAVPGAGSTGGTPTPTAKPNQTSVTSITTPATSTPTDVQGAVTDKPSTETAGTEQAKSSDQNAATASTAAGKSNAWPIIGIIAVIIAAGSAAAYALRNRFTGKAVPVAPAATKKPAPKRTAAAKVTSTTAAKKAPAAKRTAQSKRTKKR